MAGKVLRVSSNDLYGNVDDRSVSVFACFEHTKYMNNYVIFSFVGDKNKLCYGSIHFKNNSLVIFNVKEDVKKYIDQFLSEYLTDKLTDFKILDISKFNKVELVANNVMEYDKIQMLDDKSIPKVNINDESVNIEKKPIFLYILVVILILFGIGITILYFMPDLFTVKNKLLECSNNLYDNEIGLNYDINKEIIFDHDDKVSEISVIRTYTFLDSDSYYMFKNDDIQNQYFTNGEGYKYIDNELKFKVFYDEDTVIDDYDEMYTYMKREGFSCIEREYEE